MNSLSIGYLRDESTMESALNHMKKSSINKDEISGDMLNHLFVRLVLRKKLVLIVLTIVN